MDLWPNTDTHTHTHTHTLIPCITGATVMTYCSVSSGCTAAPSARSHFVLQTNMHLAGCPHTIHTRSSSSHTVTYPSLHCTARSCVVSYPLTCVCEHKRGKTTQAVTMTEEGRGETGRGREGDREIHLPFLVLKHERAAQCCSNKNCVWECMCVCAHVWLWKINCWFWHTNMAKEKHSLTQTHTSLKD